jgi:hypothetical protein
VSRQSISAGFSITCCTYGNLAAKRTV